MKITIITASLFLSAITGCSNVRSKDSAADSTPIDKTTDSFHFTFKSAHANVQALMTDEFYWSPIEETAPFGSDDGSDAAYGFRRWRLLNNNSTPVLFLNDLITSWNYPYFDYNEMDTLKIKAFLTSQTNPGEDAIEEQMKLTREAFKNSGDTSMNELDDKKLKELILNTSQKMGGTFLLGQDNAIIGIGFAQFALEGHIDKDIRYLTTTAIKRQLLPTLINRYDEPYQSTRRLQLAKMLKVVEKAESFN